MIEITEVDTYCMLDNEKYSMFCFSEVLRNCSEITYVVLSTETAAKEQARDVLIMLPESLDKLRFLCNNPFERGARDTKNPPETGWEASLWQQGRVNLCGSQEACILVLTTTKSDSFKFKSMTHPLIQFSIVLL